MSIKEPKNEKFKEAVKIVQTLQNKGYETYLAGGCVRDMLMGKEPKDFDISTSAKPKEIEGIFSKTKAVGKKFGVILVLGKTEEFEVATFRGEEEYKDARRPSKVFWVSSKEDAKRRDFTVNGLFYDPIAKKIIDFVNGQEDIEKKIIKFIGNPDERIKEDNLRILRAVRFKNTLGFKYDKETEKALKKNAKLVQNVSKERIKNELDLILEDRSRAQGILDLSRLGILKYILPEIEKMKGAKQPPQFHSEGDVFEHTILSLRKLPEKVSREAAWATLLHDIGKPDTSKVREHPKYGKRITFYGHTKLGAEITDKICRRLRFSKKEREKVVFLVLEHLRHKDIPKMKLARQRKWAQNPLFPELMVVWKADSEASYLGKKGVDLSLYNYAKKLYEKEQKQPKPPKLLLNGNDVMKTLNIPSGPLVGKILRQVEEAQLENKIKTKKEAIEYIKGLKIT
jgi:poly(A) polymerase